MAYSVEQLQQCLQHAYYTRAEVIYERTVNKLNLIISFNSIFGVFRSIMTDIKKYPLVSIAIITYNQKDFLRECIESCLAQDYPNIEIIVADDCSTDGTQEMLLEYESLYKNKFILRLANENKGITENSNLAHFACNGKYIAWIGGDDLMLPNKISKQVDYMERNLNCTISYHDLDVFQNETGSTLYSFSEKNKPREGDVRTVIKYGVFNGACSTMVRTSKAPKNGYNNLIPVASDWLYWVESLSNGGTIDYLNEVLGRYRRHKNNVTNKSELIGQGAIDHLNTCNYILSKYPECFDEATYRYSINIRSLRFKLPYFRSLLYCFKNTFDIRSVFCIFVFIFTFGYVKI